MSCCQADKRQQQAPPRTPVENQLELVRLEVTRLKQELIELEEASSKAHRESKIETESKDRMVERLLAEIDELKVHGDRHRLAHKDTAEQLVVLQEAHSALKDDFAIEHESAKRMREANDSLTEQVGWCPSSHTHSLWLVSRCLSLCLSASFSESPDSFVVPPIPISPLVAWYVGLLTPKPCIIINLV
jgi:hypothetical protein